ncbi:DDE-type integrase/transposase/recombinase [Paenibacillus medicaginis]|uniref:DDE-type integrase/transposase/recombinase n=1 Tax=Paenibacillus medicaginis TaxID=1470560 RepID=A0ABV5BVI5_9BACL
MNHNRVQRIMQLDGLQCRVEVKKRKPTEQPAYIAKHLLRRQFEADAPMKNLLWILHIRRLAESLYPPSILDLFNGEIVAYSIADKQDSVFELDTLNQLLALLGMMLHSDQGSFYTSQVVKGKGITINMSRKGTPADNAPSNCLIPR